jgi:hypothetical protein
MASSSDRSGELWYAGYSFLNFRPTPAVKLTKVTADIHPFRFSLLRVVLVRSSIRVLCVERADMTSLTGRTTSFVAVALLIPFMAAIWLMVQPTFISRSTYAVFAAILISTAAIAINAWQNAQAPTSTSEIIHEAEIGPRT